MKRTYLLVLLALAGCAKQPGSIKAVDVPPTKYMAMNCTDLFAERRRVGAEHEALSISQKKAADTDALSVFLIGVPVSGSNHDERENRISELKGQLATMWRVYDEKKCGS